LRKLLAEPPADARLMLEPRPRPTQNPPLQTPVRNAG
jgi:hypothetical protein